MPRPKQPIHTDVADFEQAVVGEIRDETDHDEMSELRKVKDNTYIIDGSKTVKDINEELNLELPDEEDYDTIAGFILTKLQSLPKKGRKIKHENLTFTIEKMEQARIAEIKLTITPTAN